MRRSFTRTVLVLRSRPSGESNREVWLLTAEEGIIRATVFGGPKSRLRSHASPFHSGTVWLYHDPVRDSRKITDFDVVSWRPGLRELYERTMTANALAETVLASHGGGGNWKAALDLFSLALDSLEEAPADGCPPVFVRFLWNWAALLGGCPGLECASSACESADDGVLWYNREEGIFLCTRCAGLYGTGGNEDGAAAGLLALGPGARRWLAAPGDALSILPRCSPDAPSLREARSVAAVVMEDILGTRPATWNEV
ncbi:MAG: recombination protein O N-terminal domain-containing protein [Treponema sp.]|jgi:DNA repair protein RecO (recombination protein O)|nr:recombination protein O N-terminal domain-containing protein [Treponema sp.]